MTNLNFLVDTNFVLHYSRVMQKVTITVDEEVARWARIQAAEHNTSVSRLVGEMLQEKMLAEKRYQMAMDQYLSQPPRELKDPAAKYPTREELYGR